MRGWQNALMLRSLSAAGTGMSSESASSKSFQSMLMLRGFQANPETLVLLRSRCSTCQANPYFRVNHRAGCNDRAVQELSALYTASLTLKLQFAWQMPHLLQVRCVKSSQALGFTQGLECCQIDKYDKYFRSFSNNKHNTLAKQL